MNVSIGKILKKNQKSVFILLPANKLLNSFIYILAAEIVKMQPHFAIKMQTAGLLKKIMDTNANVKTDIKSMGTKTVILKIQIVLTIVLRRQLKLPSAKIKEHA